MSFYLDGEILYERSFDETLLRYLNENEIEQILKEVHEGKGFVLHMLMGIQWQSKYKGQDISG